MQAVPAPYVYASDATVTRGAVLESEPLSEEDVVFMWSRRQQKWENMVRSGPESKDLYEFPAAPRPEQDSLMEHKLLSLRMRVGASYRFRHCSHINVQELLAYRTALKMAARTRMCRQRRVSFFIGSQVVVNVIARGRSSSHQLNFVLQTCLALSLFCDISPLPIWVGTEENPADDRTRGRPLRECVPLQSIAEQGVQKALEKYCWTLLVTRAQWDARKKMWDGSMGWTWTRGATDGEPRGYTTFISWYYDGSGKAAAELAQHSEAMGQIDTSRDEDSATLGGSPGSGRLCLGPRTSTHCHGLDSWIPLDASPSRDRQCKTSASHPTIRYRRRIGQWRVCRDEIQDGYEDESLTGGRCKGAKAGRADPPDCLWVRGGIVTLQKNFLQLKDSLALTRTPLGSLRAGGAVEYFCWTSNGSGLQVRGPWVSQRSMFHYTKLSLAAVSMSHIAPDSRARVFSLACMAVHC
eukprot:2655823-Amphidinium_carterae.1